MAGMSGQLTTSLDGTATEGTASIVRTSSLTVAEVASSTIATPQASSKRMKIIANGESNVVQFILNRQTYVEFRQSNR